MSRSPAGPIEAFPRQFWLIAGGVLVSSCGSSLVWPFQFIYISRTLGLHLSTVATLITLSSIAGLLVSVAGGSIADRLGRKPVMMDERLGEQSGNWQYARSKRVPIAASRSMFGDFTIGCP